MTVMSDHPDLGNVVMFPGVTDHLEHGSHAGTVDDVQPSAFDVMASRVHAAAEIAGVPFAVADVIATPDRIIELNLAVKMDDGSIRQFTAYRVQHSVLRGPGKGGVKISTDTSRDSVMALACGMTLKTAALGLPLGGAKGGIVADAHRLSWWEKRRLLRAYAKELAPNLGQPGRWIEVPAPDMATSGEDMKVIAAAIGELYGGPPCNEVVTGKPVEFGGLEARPEATGFGVAHIADLHRPLSGSRVIVAGFGNVGSHAAAEVERRNGHVHLIFDPFLGGALTSTSRPIPITDLLEFIAEHGRTPTTFERYVATRKLQLHASFHEGLAAIGTADVFLPCAAPQSVTEADADTLINLGVSVVCEGANSPLQIGAAARLADSHVVVIPDTLANSGGVASSWREMSKAASLSDPTREETLAEVASILERTNRLVVSTAAQHELSDLRVAADIVAVKLLADALRSRHDL